MQTSHSLIERPLDFLKIWHNVFSKNIEYAVEHNYPDMKMTPEGIRDDVQCQIGLWLSAQKDEVRSLENYAHLILVHRKFHVVASEVTQLHQNGKLSGAQDMLESQFHESSNAVCTAIDALSHDLVRMGVYVERFPNQGKSQKSIWDESFEIGIPEVDRHHHAIAILIDQVLVNGDIECASNEGSRFLNVLTKMIKHDIETENVYLADLVKADQDYSKHIQAHEAILSYLEKLHDSIRRVEVISFEEVGRYLANWYIDHLVTHDLDLEGL